MGKRWWWVIGGLALLAVTVLVIVLLRPSAAPESPAVTYSEQAQLPPRAAEPTQSGLAGLVDADWADSTSAATGIPRRALLAYAGAALVKAEVSPECGLGWNTLAGVGFVESDHGRHGGNELDDNGTAQPGIFGAVLDGGATENIPDSDGGAVDGITEFDRAVGPFQFIPEAWANWAYDSTGDGADPQNIDDSAAAASNYLCRAAGEVESDEGWRAAVDSYNTAGGYLESVSGAAQRYADAARN